MGRGMGGGRGVDQGSIVYVYEKRYIFVNKNKNPYILPFLRYESVLIDSLIDWIEL